MTVLSIIGTRPEALKLGPVLRVLDATGGIKSLVCTTGQHRELLRSPLREFGVRPDFDFTLRRPDTDPATLLALLLPRLRTLLRRVRPDWVMAVGDTTSVLAAALAAAHQRVPFAHVEAGLRTGCKGDPFPEEINRRLVTTLADLHFAPTRAACDNLRRESVPPRRIVVTGNPIIDALRDFSRRREPPGLASLWRRLDLAGSALPAAPRLLVATFHRRENLGAPLRDICAALRDLARQHRGSIRILCIIHPNPAVRAPAERALKQVPHIVLSRPLSYPAMIAVLKRTHLLLTDSGGLQEEAPGLGLPVLILRNRTERPEGVAAGVARLAGTSRAGIVRIAGEMLAASGRAGAKGRIFKGYGDGRAAPRIVRALLAATTRRGEALTAPSGPHADCSVR